MSFVFLSHNEAHTILFPGRAIRHQGDYATILLLDQRYSRASTVAKLPGWISEHLQKMDKFGPVFAAVSKASNMLSCSLFLSYDLVIS